MIACPLLLPFRPMRIKSLEKSKKKKKKVFSDVKLGI